MSTNTKNSILLFGDYGTEVIRLSQLYDPEKDRYQLIPANYVRISGEKYYAPVIKKRTVSFTEVTTGLPEIGQRFSTRYWRDTWSSMTEEEQEACDQNGTYVPAPQTLVVVDRDVDDRWGTYTLLIVDKVYDGTEENDETYAALDDESKATYVPSYQSTIVPINFSGGVDTATRAIDYESNQMMLYVEDITYNHSGTNISTQRLVPDRKLMMYGTNTMRYIIRKNIGGIDTIISTNSLKGSHAGAQEYIGYISASAKAVEVTNEEIYKSLVGKTVEYFTEEGSRIKETVTVDLDLENNLVTTSDGYRLYCDLKAAYDRGEAVLVQGDSSDVLTSVQLPGACYRSYDTPTLVAGEVLDFMVYETAVDATTGSSYNRLVFASKVTVKTGAATDTADVTSGVITGFEVKYGTNEVSDLWQIPQITTDAAMEAFKENLRPYLTMDDGGEQVETLLSTDNNALYMYGIDRILNAKIGTEMDILFKFFPHYRFGVKSNSTIDSRYTKVGLDLTDIKTVGTTKQIDSDTNRYILNRTPSSIQRYYVKDDDGNYVLAGDDGYLTQFLGQKVSDSTDKGITYYTLVSKFAWDSVVSRPTREMLVCRKRVRIVSPDYTNLRKIIPVPYWVAETEKWKFNFLVYLDDYNAPKLVSTEDSDNGSVMVTGGMPEFPKNPLGEKDETIYNLNLRYKPGSSSTPLATTKELAMMLQHWTTTNSAVVDERWLFGWTHATSFNSDPDSEAVELYGNIPYGRHNALKGVIRPFLYCQVVDDNDGGTYGKYRIPIRMTNNSTTGEKRGFPCLNSGNTINADNHFLTEFYMRAIAGDDTWFTSVNSEDTDYKYPTHFRIRSATAEIYSQVFPIVEDGNPMAYARSLNEDSEYVPNYLTARGLPVPTADCDAIVVIEFMTKTGELDGKPIYNYLVGVPVEVKLQTFEPDVSDTGAGVS